MDKEKLKLAFGDALAFLKSYWRIIAVLIALILLIWFVSTSMESCSNWFDERNANKMKTNINALETNANKLEAEVNKGTGNYANAKNETNVARSETNRSLDNLNAVNSVNYNGTDINRARQAQCRYNPERCR